MKNIFFITGASGVGKTSLISELKNKYSNKDNWVFLHFDSLGVPSVENMVKKYGSIENWQKEITKIWIEKMLKDYNDDSIIIFEGQVNSQFIISGFTEEKFSNYEIILIDCNEEIMGKRLIESRGQGELFNEDMKNWLKYLRNQAKELNINIIDTSNLSKKTVLNTFENILIEKNLLI